MLSHKREARVVVIKGRIAPATGGMTGTTICAELSIMGIPGSVTGITIRRRSLIHTVRMAGRALNTGMSSRKREAGIVVVEGYIAPAAGGMTGTAVRTELSIVPVL
jgi:hypothetical protein